MGSLRFIFAFSTSLIIQSVTVQFVRYLGGAAAAWRTVAMCITPMLVEKMNGLYRMNLAGYILGTAGRVGVIFAGYMGSVPFAGLYCNCRTGNGALARRHGGSCSKLL